MPNLNIEVHVRRSYSDFYTIYVDFSNLSVKKSFIDSEKCSKLVISFQQLDRTYHYETQNC